MSVHQDLDAQSLQLFERMQASKQAYQSDEEKLHGEREGYRRIIPLGGVIEALPEIRDEVILTDFGAIPIRIYRPSIGKHLPVMVYFHGGGYVAGGLDTHDQQMRYFAKHGELVVIAVAYSLAPERPYPAAINDAYHAMKWVWQHTEQLIVDSNRIIIGGDSAGGLLSALTVQRLRDTTAIPLAFQLLLCPNLDLTMETNSWRQLGHKGYILSTEKQLDFYRWFLPEGTNRRNEMVSPLFATDFSGLPPTLVVTASADPLKDDGRQYAERLRTAGVPVIYREYEGMLHGFFQLSGVIDKGAAALSDICAILNEQFPG